MSCQPAPTFHNRVPDWVAELRKSREQGETAVLVAETSGRAERVIEILRDYGVVAADISRAEVSGSALLVTTGQLTQGFRLPNARLRLYAETDIFDEERVGHQRRASAARAFLSDFRDLKVGDHVVLTTLGSCGLCDACDRGQPTHCRDTMGRLSRPFTVAGEKAFQFANAGVFTERTVVAESQAVVIDKALA